MNIRFDNRNVLVTGAGSGIGRALVIKLVELGANVIAVSKSQANLDSLKIDCNCHDPENERLKLIQLDLANWPETGLKLNNLVYNIDMLVNNAAASDSVELGSIKEETLDYLFAVNYKSCINLIQLVAKGMKERKFGSIVNVSSVSAISAMNGHGPYGSTKAAIDLMTKIGAKELGPFNIRVNSVNPTVVWTKMGEKFWSDESVAAEMKSKIPMNRFVTVDEVVDPILFLLSPHAGMINGVLLPIDGGFVAN